MGIGKKLLEYTFTILKEKYTYVLISTLKQNSAKNFYLKCGGNYVSVINPINRYTKISDCSLSHWR